jgi:hypothetical protein
MIVSGVRRINAPSHKEGVGVIHVTQVIQLVTLDTMAVNKRPTTNLLSRLQRRGRGQRADTVGLKSVHCFGGNTSGEESSRVNINPVGASQGDQAFI